MDLREIEARLTWAINEIEQECDSLMEKPRPCIILEVADSLRALRDRMRKSDKTRRT